MKYYNFRFIILIHCEFQGMVITFFIYIILIII